VVCEYRKPRQMLAVQQVGIEPEIVPIIETVRNWRIASQNTDDRKTGKNGHDEGDYDSIYRESHIRFHRVKTSVAPQCSITIEAPYLMRCDHVTCAHLASPSPATVNGAQSGRVPSQPR
jgi:hypothetical protein